MKKIVFLGLLIVFLPAMVCSQDKIEAPVWNVGDKWVFTKGNIEVIGADKNSYALHFSKDTLIAENVGFETIIFEKSKLNRIYTVTEDKRERYTQARRRILNFPFYPGKQWEDTFAAKSLYGADAGLWTMKYSESFAIIGWEDVEVRARKFKAIKLEYKQKNITGGIGIAWEAWIRYWYSPDVKYFVKCQYDKNNLIGMEDWELVSFELKK